MMKANRNKLELAMISGKSAKPATIGRIARALGVDVTEILETEN